MTLESDNTSPVASGETTTFLNKTGTKGVLCGKCNHLNRPCSSRCSRCQSHLHIKCNDCGTINERALDHCRECGRRLHRSVMDRISSKSGQGRRIKPIYVAILLVFAAGAFYIALALIQHLELPPIQ